MKMVMEREYRFEADIQPIEDLDGAYVGFPYNVETEFGTKGQVKVVAASTRWGIEVS